MPAKVKEHVYPNISQLKLRKSTNFDFRQFKEFMLDSKGSISTFLDIGKQVPELHTVDFMNFYTSLLNDQEREHFGVFHGWKMLAYASFSPAFDSSGIQIVYFVRQEYLRQNIGTFTLGKMTSKAWVDYDFHFVQAVVDKANIGSRRIVKAQGFEPLYAVKALGQGDQASTTQICYVYINPKLKMKASVYNKRAIDLIGHFCFLPDLEHLIYDEKVNRYFEWKYPIYVEDDIDEEGLIIFSDSLSHQFSEKTSGLPAEALLHLSIFY